MRHSLRHAGRLGRTSQTTGSLSGPPAEGYAYVQHCLDRRISTCCAQIYTLYRFAEAPWMLVALAACS